MLQTIVFSQIASAPGVRRFTRADFFDPISDRWGNDSVGPRELCHPYRKIIAYCAKARRTWQLASRTSWRSRLISPVRLGAERQQGTAELLEGGERHRKDQLGPSDGNSQVTFVACRLADGDRCGGHRGTLHDRLIGSRRWIAPHDADLA